MYMSFNFVMCSCWCLCGYVGVYAYDVNVLGGSVNTIERNTEAWLVANKNTGLEVNADKTKYMVLSRDQNAGRIHNVKGDSNSF
jgi:hypothetical protein